MDVDSSKFYSGVWRGEIELYKMGRGIREFGLRSIGVRFLRILIVCISVIDIVYNRI